MIFVVVALYMTVSAIFAVMFWVIVVRHNLANTCRDKTLGLLDMVTRYVLLGCSVKLSIDSIDWAFEYVPSLHKDLCREKDFYTSKSAASQV